jgi:hypothetical protein
LRDIYEKQKRALQKDLAKCKRLVKDKARDMLRIKGELSV